MNLTHRIAICAAALALYAPLSFAAGPEAGDVAPDLLGKMFNGDKVLVSTHAGKVVVVSFWATWCTYCLKELPILEGLQKVAGKGRVEVIAVNTEDRDTFRDVLRKLKDLKMTLAYDPSEVGAKAYGVDGLPHLVIIGRDGKIVRVYRGYGEDTLAKIVDDINVAIAATPTAKAGAAP
ncbi:MAG: TlpA disulfide reductase family protein [Pseudomonadota bacterium]